MSFVELYDTTLRDGAQFEGISLSVDDKLAIASKLDQLGVHYIEGGWPGSNPKDAEFFEKAKELQFANATLAAFGSTRRANIDVDKDDNIRTLVESEAPVITLVGKSWDLHVTDVLETSLEENLAMIADSVSYLKSKERRVFFDAEHFFDGYKANPDYASQAVRVAEQAGAECVILCDTNGGTLPDEIAGIVGEIRRESNVALGIHTHNDSDTAVAGALAAVSAGVTQIQGTINGYGERCGNANLLSIIANLKTKMGLECVTDDQLRSLTDVSRYVSEIANMPMVASQPYVGVSAFAHKRGLHASAVAKVERSYQHIDPPKVGNDKRVLVSELSGRSNILYKVNELGLNIDLSQAQTRQLLEEVKQKESEGFQYEGAEASFELLVRRTRPEYRCPFELVEFVTMIGKHPRPGSVDNLTSQVMLKVQVGDEVMHTASDGNGPVNALDNALRKGLLQFYPSLESVRLADFKVRVLIESTDGSKTWHTVGASPNIIEASWIALSDSLEYWLTRQDEKGKPR